MARLPVVGGDDDTWGDVLNEYLQVAHQSDGQPKYDLSVPAGLLASRPAASAANAGLVYFATDDNGGTAYRSNGVGWNKLARGVTQAPVAHKSSHAIGGDDVLTPADIGAGDVTGPAGSTDNAVARFDGTTGKLVQNSSVTVSDSGDITAANIAVNGATAFGSGSGVMAIKDATTVPTTSPTGGVVAYAEGGVLKVRQADNTVVTVGNTAVSVARQVTTIINGGGVVLATGSRPMSDISMPFNCTITKWRLLAPNESGSIVLDIWKDTYANWPATDADSITASAKPTLSSAQKAESTTLTGWTTAITEGDVLRVEVESVTSLTAIVLELTVVPT